MHDDIIPEKQKVVDTELINMVKLGNESAVRSLLEKKSDVNCLGRHLMSPLIHAVKYPNVIRVLLASNPNIEATDMFNTPPLFHAVQIGVIQSVVALLDSKANVHFQNNERHISALSLAASTGNNPILQLLINRKADINQKNIRGMTALMFAAKNGFFEIVKVLVDAKACIHNPDVTGRTALDYAITEKKTEVVKILQSLKLKNQMLSLVSGLHPRLGENSALLQASHSSLWEKHTLSIVKEMLDESKQIIATNYAPYLKS